MNRKAFTTHSSWIEWFKHNLLFLFFVNVLAISLLVTSLLFIIHTYFMITNKTTWERFSRRNITYLMNLNSDSFNPFHQGYLSNVANFLCYRHVKWEDTYIKLIGVNCQDSVSETDQEDAS